jgi:predicted RNA binding protein YcfA (HicA-like mRNA interferase family)
MKLPLLSSQELCSFLEKEGFSVVRQKGSHRFYRHIDGRTTVVPIHANKDVSRGLLKAIFEEIGMNREEFFKKFK